MNRSDWLKAKRREAEERYNTLWAPIYGEKVGVYGNATHQEFMHRFLRLLPQPGAILDAACGAGRYLPMLLQKGHTPVGTDQSAGMLARLKTLYPDVRTEKVGLQELSFEASFDGAICMDAMENVSPEDWPLVLRNLHQALKPQAHLYFTVEIADEQEVQQAFDRAQQAGLPVVRGEWPDESVYHYYPSRQQVKEWLHQAGFELVDEGAGDGYHHFIVRRVP